MENGRRSIMAILGDLRRMIAPLDILYAIGSLIYRRSLRYTLLTAGIAALGLVAKSIGLPGFTVKQAIVLPLLIGGLSLVVGVLLKVVPSLIASKLLTVAQASDLNLMEDYRKAQGDEHLNALWERLFAHECRMHIAAGHHGPLGHCGCQNEAEALAHAKEGFFVRAAEALASPMPQIQQMFHVGLDLRFLEDWRDGAYLDRSDTKLVEQFEGSAVLSEARAEVGLTGLAAAMLFNAHRLSQRFWFAVVTRMVAIQAATDIEKLNRQFDTDLFDTQLLLWPGTEDGEWLNHLPGAREELLEFRRKAVRRIFGRDWPTARGVLDSMLYCSFASATELRMRYDPDYCDAALGYDVLGDLAAEGRNRRDFERARGFVGPAKAKLALLGEFCRAHRPELLAPSGAEDLRIARLAVHTDRRGPARMVLSSLLADWDHARSRRGSSSPRPAGNGQDGSAAEPEMPDAEIAATAERVSSTIDQAIRDKVNYTRRLLAVRMHHELTRLSRKGYEDLVETLGYRHEHGPKQNELGGWAPKGPEECSRGRKPPVRTDSYKRALKGR